MTETNKLGDSCIVCGGLHSTPTWVEDCAFYWKAKALALMDEVNYLRGYVDRLKSDYKNKVL